MQLSLIAHIHVSNPTPFPAVKRLQMANLPNWRIGHVSLTFLVAATPPFLCTFFFLTQRFFQPRSGCNLPHQSSMSIIQRRRVIMTREAAANCLPIGRFAAAEHTNQNPHQQLSISRIRLIAHIHAFNPTLFRWPCLTMPFRFSQMAANDTQHAVSCTLMFRNSMLFFSRCCNLPPIWPQQPKIPVNIAHCFLCRFLT